MAKRMEATKFLVPLNGEKMDANTLRLACTIARSEKGKVYAIYVIEVKRALPLDAEIEPETGQAEEVLKRAERIGDEMDCEVVTELLQAREIGPAIVDEAVERGIDVIIMAIPRKKPFGEFELGNTVPYVLKHAPCRVLVWRESVDIEEP